MNKFIFANLIFLINIVQSYLPKFNENMYFEETMSLTNEQQALQLFKHILNETSNNQQHGIEILNIQIQNSTIGRKCLVKCIQSGWFNVSQYLITKYFNPNQIDLYDTMCQARKALSYQYLEQFENLTKLLPPDSPFLTIIHPAFQWAQSLSTVAIKIKFSPTLDMPGFLEVMNFNLTTQLRFFNITAYNYQTDFPIKFVLEVFTNQHIMPNIKSHHVKKTELGTVEVYILKGGQQIIWRNIHLDIHYKPPNQYFWWDMQAQLRDQAAIILDSTMQMREMKQDDDQINEEKIVRDKRLLLKRLKQEKENNQLDLKNRQYCWNSYNNKKCRLANPFDWYFWFYE